MKELDIQQESLAYTVRFAKPLFEMWGKGGTVLGSLYEALSPYGVSLANIVVSNLTPNAAEPQITVWLQGKSSVKFAFDRIEFAINQPTQDFFAALPQLFEATTTWIKRDVPQFRFTSHHFAYYCHALVKDGTAREVLDAANPKALRAGGASMGNATIFHNSVADKNWTTHFWLDHSQVIPGALFVGLHIDTATEQLDYETTLAEGKEYLGSLLAEVNISMPELVQ